MSTRAFAVLVLTLFVGAACVLPGSDPASGSVGKESPPPDPDDPAALRFTTERVVVFKDGYALLVQRGTATADASGRVFTHTPPEGAVLGTFWATPVTEGVTIDAMRAEQREIVRKTSEEGACGSIGAVLAASTEREVELARGDAERLSGIVVDVLEDAALVVLQTPSGRHMVPIASVNELSGANLPTVCETATETKESVRELSFELGAGAAGREVELRLFSFSAGIRWIPTYRVALDDDEAKVALSGEVLNELIDIDGPVDLVVGVPHFKFKHVPSPLSLERVLRNTLAEAMPQLMGNNLSNVNFYNQRATERVAPSTAATATPAAPPEVANADAHELFVYSVPQLRLAKGARASVTLLRHDVPVAPVYTATLQAGPRSYGVTANPMWHSLRLTNDGTTPWTTGPALVLQGDLPLGQDLLTFTPPGHSTILPVTTATTVRAIADEVERDRTDNALRWQRRHYARVRKHASVTVTNTKDRAVDVEITLNATGRASEASDDGDIQVIATGGVDPRLVTRWALTLDPGETRTLTLDYASHE